MLCSYFEFRLYNILDCLLFQSANMLTGSYQCYDEINPYFVGCGKILGGWAVGGSGTSFPVDSGFPVGGHSHPQYVMVEMHYDNPEIKGSKIRMSKKHNLFQICFIRISGQLGHADFVCKGKPRNYDRPSRHPTFSRSDMDSTRG